MFNHSIQSSFLEEVKKKLPPAASFADELAETLSISRDSAYRRIRGETVLSLDEAKVLCNQFGVSLDSILGNTTDIIPFRHLVVNHLPQTFEQWLKTMLHNLELIHSFSGEKELIFTAKDVPVFHYFNYPKLSAFKMFFWMKSVLNYPQFQVEKFRPDAIIKEYMALGEKIWSTYSKVDSIELWSDETTNVTLKQLEFYYESGFFSSANDALDILNEYQQMLLEIKDEAAKGHKNDKGLYTLFKNEILIADNTVMFKLGAKRAVYISHNITELLLTSNEGFCDHTEQFITNLQNRSILISTTGEKERNKFFNRMEEKIEAVKKRLA